MTGTARQTALYVHVPFCATRCDYCDFTSSTEAGVPGRLDAYVAATTRMLTHWTDSGLLESVPSVYFGGGTPTMLGDRLPRLIAHVAEQIGLAEDAEITFEANPESLTPDLLDVCIAAGANRVSLGVQSFDDSVLRILGRCHDANVARQAVALLGDSGWSFSVDLMCGVPGLDDAVWQASVMEAAESGAGHVSVYPLSVEEGTRLECRISEGDLGEPDPDTAADQMAAAAQLLTARGFERYEIASYAKPGRRARHNTGYWRGMPYIGIGPGAASMLPRQLASADPVLCAACSQECERVRFVMHDGQEDFLSSETGADPAFVEALSAEQSAREDVMLGLRMTDGVDGALVSVAGVGEVLERLADRGLVECVGGTWRLTQRGWLLGNEVFSEVL